MSNSIRPFIGSYDFNESRAFYIALGYKELVLTPVLSYFESKSRIGFYLQDYYVKDWVDNTMLFLEVENVEAFREDVCSSGVIDSYPSVRISEIKVERWGSVFTLHDPAGVLWQIGRFKE